ncbi:MAG: ribonuclease D [Gammaproteobacteria bacterium]|nr:ribonuclease D [Gammaproteobacteria bacterium]
MPNAQAEEFSFEFIDSTADLQRACAQLSDQPCLAVDTEFVREKTYYPVLCLIQIASPDFCACIDPLAIDDLSPLANILLNQAITKVFHAARQDQEVLQQTLGAIPAPVFDTQIAATLLGLGDQIGYANLVRHFLDVQLAKGHARTDWERRPLSHEQLSYAADDVRYLIALYPLMRQALTELGRLDWLAEDFAALTSPQLYHNDPPQQWMRVSGVQKLKGVQLAILQQLAAWREQQAQQHNKPRKWILSDDILLAIAMQAPHKSEQLERIRGIPPATVQRHGQTLLDLIAQAKALPKNDWPILSRRRTLSPNQEALLDALMAIIKLEASAQQINATALSTRADLEALITGESDVPLLHGWRHGIAGHQVQAFLQGQTQLAVTAQGTLTTTTND